MLEFLEWLQFEYRMSKNATLIDLPKVEQTTNYSCGAACLRAVCLYFGVGPKDEDSFIEMLKSNQKDGTNPINLISVARGLGLHAFGRQHMTIETLKNKLMKKIPVICAVQAWGAERSYDKDKSGHYVIAIGFDDNKIYFEDPVLKKSRGVLKYREFLDRWHDTDGNGKKYERFGISVWNNSEPAEKSDAKTTARIQ